jgi:hypothetical protein
MFLQNQWFKDPDRVRQSIAAGVERFGDSYRRRFLTQTLFMGCATGRNLGRVFGPWCQVMDFDESSKNIGGNAASVFPADLEHMRAIIAQSQPAAVIALGKIAGDALATIVREGKPVDFQDAEKMPGAFRPFYGPHPTARQPDTMQRLRTVRDELEAWAGEGGLRHLPESGTLITDDGAFCRECWNKGRALWVRCCKCTGDVT